MPWWNYTAEMLSDDYELRKDIKNTISYSKGKRTRLLKIHFLPPLCRWPPLNSGLTYDTLTLCWCKGGMHLSRNHPSHFEFWIWISSPASVALLWCWAEAAAPSPLCSHGGEQQYPSGLRQPVWFSLLVQHWINFRRDSTLHCKLSFVLDDFAQL